MFTLADTQDALRRAIVLSAPVDLAFIAGSRNQAAARLGIHVRHFRQSLARALERSFPAVVSLVDQRFFAYCADTFIEASPPIKPCLFEYGSHFPNFLATFGPCAALPYLPDVARLEWDMHAVFHDLGPDPMAPERWLARGVRLLRSKYPIHRVWQVARGGSESSVDLDGGGVDLVVYRDEADVTFESLSPAASAFLSQLRVARSRLYAMTSACSLDAAFSVDRDIPRAVAKYLALETKPPTRDQANARDEG